MQQSLEATLTAVKNEAIGDTEGKYLTFLTDHQHFGVPIADVVQIVGMQTITEIPEYPSYAKGIINLRGNIIPVIDIRLRLGKYEADYTDRTCIVVVNIQNHEYGFIVDEVEEVTDIGEELISPPPQLTGGEVSYITGIAKLDNKIVLLLDASKILGNSELEALIQAI